MFIVGAAKAGTTSLWYILKQHPQIFMPEDLLNKEPSYFSNLTGMRDEREYLALFSQATGNEKFIGEASTAYLTDPGSAKRISEFDPDAKIIILLRNPVFRAYSLYNWMVQEGYEYSRSFEIALSREKKRQKKNIPNLLEPEYYYDYLYYSSGVYLPQVERYLYHFDSLNVFIGTFEDFIARQQAFLSKIVKFLKIDNYHFILDSPQNPSKRVVHPYLTFLIRYFIRIKNFMQQNQDKEKRDYLLKTCWLEKSPAPMNSNTYAKLLSKYEHDYDELEDRFSLNLQPWRL